MQDVFDYRSPLGNLGRITDPLFLTRWWRRHWERTGIIEVQLADTMPDGWQRWRDWHKTMAPDNSVEIKALEADAGEYLGYVRLFGRRRADVELAEPIVSIPPEYTKKPLLREEG